MYVCPDCVCLRALYGSVIVCVCYMSMSVCVCVFCACACVCGRGVIHVHCWAVNHSVHNAGRQHIRQYERC